MTHSHLLPRRTLMTATALLPLAWAVGCTRKSQEGPKEAPQARAEYRGPLVDPATIPGDFLWEQRVSAIHGEKKGAFDAVLQKRGAELLILGLTPMKTRGFALTQRNAEFEYKQFVPFELPFSPASILYDVHRCFFYELLGSFPSSGVRQGSFEQERLVDEFEGGHLIRRVFENVSDTSASITIEYSPPGYFQGVPPRTVSLKNGGYGYQLTVTTSTTRRL